MNSAKSSDMGQKVWKVARGGREGLRHYQYKEGRSKLTKERWDHEVAGEAGEWLTAKSLEGRNTNREVPDRRDCHAPA